MSTALSLLKARGNYVARAKVAPILEYVEIELTNAQIKAMRAAPVTILAAPGAGLVAELVEGSLLLDAGTNVLTESADNMALRYVDGSGVLVSEAIEATGFIDQAGDMLTNIRKKLDGIATKAQCENKAIVLHNTGDGEYAGNAALDAKLRVKAVFRITVSGW